MRLAEHEILAGLEHPNVFVRDNVLHYFENARRRDVDIAKRLIAVVERLGWKEAFLWPHRIGGFDLDDESFRERFRRTPLWRGKRRGVLRNAAIVLGNARDPGMKIVNFQGLSQNIVTNDAGFFRRMVPCESESSFESGKELVGEFAML